MTFLRLKTDSAGRVYLYEEERHREAGKVKSISRSHGRVNGFWLAVACLMGEIFQTKVNGYDPDEAERQALEVQQRQKEADEKKMWEVTHPQWGITYEEHLLNSQGPEVPAASHPEKPESAAPTGSSAVVEGQQTGAPDPSPSDSTPDPDPSSPE